MMRRKLNLGWVIFGLRTIADVLESLPWFSGKTIKIIDVKNRKLGKKIRTQIQ